MLIPIKQKYKKNKIIRAIDVYFVLREILLAKEKFDQDKETFWVVLLSTNNKIKYVDEVSVGNLHSTIVSVREVFRNAIHKGAFSIVIAHNHPSGNLEPSEADRKVVRELTEAGEILGIKVMDALIITSKSYYSFYGSSEL